MGLFYYLQHCSSCIIGVPVSCHYRQLVLKVVPSLNMSTVDSLLLWCAFLLYTAADEGGSTSQPEVSFAILTANENEKKAVMAFLGLGDVRLDTSKLKRAKGCNYSSATTLTHGSVKEFEGLRDLDYSVFTVTVDEAQIAGVHTHCDSYGPWGAFEQTKELLKTAKKKQWPLKVIFVVGCCGVSISEEKKAEKTTWCGTVLVAEEVNSYLHTGKFEPTGGADTSSIQFRERHYKVTRAWPGALLGVDKETSLICDYNEVEVKKAVYLSGPLVIKEQLFADKYRSGGIAGVEMEVLGVIQAVEAIHDYVGTDKEDYPAIVLAKGISDYTVGKKEDTICKFFGDDTDPVDDDSRQMYATLQSIALVMRCVQKQKNLFLTGK